MVYNCESSKSPQSFPQVLLFWGVLEGEEVGVFFFFMIAFIIYLTYVLAIAPWDIHCPLMYLVHHILNVDYIPQQEGLVMLQHR